MKAAVIQQFGDPDVLQLQEVPTPTPGPGEALVKVLGAGVNRFDHYLREGSVAPSLPFPHILGADAVGDVAQLGEGVEGLAVGDRVVVMPGYPSDPEDADVYPGSMAPSFALPGLHVAGSYAQYIKAPARFLVPDDTGLTAAQSATLPMVLATGVRAVKEVGEVKAGDTVLIHAGGSGAGSMQIQIATALGARVATTVRNDAKGELAASLGAELVINTRDEEFVARVLEWTEGRGVDVVIDSIGGSVLAKSLDAVRAQGVVVAFGFSESTEVSFDIRNFFFGQKQLRGTMASDIADLRWGLEQVRLGRIKPVLDRTLSLADASEAHRLIAHNQVAGNLVLLPWSG